MASFIALIYTAYVKLEEIENHLQKNTIAMDIKSIWGQAGYIGRLMRLGMIFMSLLFAPYWSKRNLLDFDEVRKLPNNLRMWVFIPTGLAVSLLTLMGILLRLTGKI